MKKKVFTFLTAALSVIAFAMCMMPPSANAAFTQPFVQNLPYVSTGGVNANQINIKGTKSWLGLQTFGGGMALSGTTVTATGGEINTLAGQIASVSQVSVPATGSNATQFTFKNAAGAPITGIRALTMYASDASGNQTAAVTSYAALTNGAITTLVAGKIGWVTTTTAGLLGLTLTASAGTYYVSFQILNDKAVTSAAIVCN